MTGTDPAESWPVVRPDVWREKTRLHSGALLAFRPYGGRHYLMYGHDAVAAATAAGVPEGGYFRLPDEPNVFAVPEGDVRAVGAAVFRHARRPLVCFGSEAGCGPDWFIAPAEVVDAQMGEAA